MVEQAIIDNGSITQVFLLLTLERAARINVELPHKAAIIAIQLYICPGGCFMIPFPLMLHAVRQSRF